MRKIHRLTDMDVEEVSVVDRAANQRKFLIVKSAGATRTGAEVVEGAGGVLVTKAPGDAPAAPPAPPAAEPAQPEPAPPATEPAPAIAPTMRIALDVREEITRRLDAVVTMFEEVRAMLSTAEVVEGTIELPPEILATLNQALDVLETGGPDQSVSKGLKQFSRSRTANLRTAYEALGSILNEIESTPAENAGGEIDAAVADVGEALADVAKSKDLRDLEATIAKGFAKLVDVVKAQHSAIAKNAERLGMIERNSAVTPSNAGGDAAPKIAPPVAWPADMNQEPHAKA